MTNMTGDAFEKRATSDVKAHEYSYQMLETSRKIATLFAH